MILSIRQVTAHYGLNASHIKNLTEIGALPVLEGCTPLRPKYAQSTVERLSEGEHYVVCRACGMWAGQITTKHLRVCSGMDLSTYVERYPGTPTLCDLVSCSRAKTEEQRIRQSETLKARFCTPEGEVTRQQIAGASQRLMRSGYREVLVERLTKMNRSAERREAISRETLARWDSGKMRGLVEGWHRDNREVSLAGAAHARSHITDRTMSKARAALNKTSKMHLRFKERMVDAGFTGFVTEGKIGPFEVDEVHFDLRLAVEIDGCYWHGCSCCGYPGVPATVANDKSKDAYLKASGWTLLRIPGHTVRKEPSSALTMLASIIEQARRSAL